MTKRSSDRYRGTSAPVTYRMPMRTLLVAILVLLAACTPTPTAKLPLTCGATTGGHAGAETQLRFVEASDSEIVLTFGAGALSLDRLIQKSRPD